MKWDAEGHLATLTEAGKTSSYVYDADGNRLIAKNADGSSTLTLPQGNELTVAANGTKTGTRYYTHNGETVAVRTGATTSYLISDHQGTAMTAITVGTLALTRRKQLPFGQLRTTQSTAFGTRGFVGGTNDPTGLTHIGAREYDPTLGRFLLRRASRPADKPVVVPLISGLSMPPEPVTPPPWPCVRQGEKFMPTPEAGRPIAGPPRR
ncbi:hypothetical protein [Streptomyces sp. NPDC004728]|uniref:hypothetical protein n=1 Tax=Streptomyces sp. NPDC004728 TaxID=3154289 RepID=UPI0033B4D6E5